MSWLFCLPELRAVRAGRTDATENQSARHPGKYSAGYSFLPGGSPRRDLAAVAEAELDQDVLDVVLRGTFGDEQRLADLLVGQPPRHQSGHLQLAGTPRRPGARGSQPRQLAVTADHR